MALLAFGINHNSAPVAVREKVAFAPEVMVEALRHAQSHAGIAELVIVSTCNRTELIAASEHEDALQRLKHWLTRFHHLSDDALDGCCYAFHQRDALRHLMRVAAGLDSMVLGEPQIFGQVKSAYAVAQEAGVIGSELSRVFQHTFNIAKRVRTDTAIGENPVSIAFAAVSLSQRIFADLRKTAALLIGAGETIELVARHLQEQGVTRLIIANRTLERAQELAQLFGAEPVMLADIPTILPQVDIVISSTASQLPILGKGAVERALKVRKHKPIFLVDIAVPRDIEPEVGDLADAYLYSVDDLRDIIDANMRAREDEARKADQLIDQGVDEFERSRRQLDAVTTLKAFRTQAEQIRDAELDKALKQLASGTRPEEVVCELARLLTNKLIHTPSVQLKKATADGRQEVLAWYQELFGLQVEDVPGDANTSARKTP
jgi:glutamyl-tRNA reductase